MKSQPSMAAIVRSARLAVCEAFVSGGPDAALAALAASSIRLTRHVDGGCLVPEIAFSALRDVAENLKLAKHLGQHLVEIALDAGPQFYEQLEMAA